MASLWIRSRLGWPERDNEVVIQTYQVGTRFEALFYHPNPSICAMCGGHSGKINNFPVHGIRFSTFFGLQEAENDLLALNANKFYSKLVFFVFTERESFLASGGQKMRKTLFCGPENPFFCHFLATRG